MGCGEEKTSVFLSNLAVHKKSNENLCSQKPVFYSNGNSIIVCSGQSCHLYDVGTGNHVKELFQCPDNIISCQLHPIQSNLLIAVSENGELFAFNLKTNEMEYSVLLQLSANILNKHKNPKFCADMDTGDESYDWETLTLDSLKYRRFLYAEAKAFHNNPAQVFVWASWCLNDEVYGHLSVFSLSKGEHMKMFNIRKTGLQKCYLNFVLGTVQELEVFVGMAKDYIYCCRFDSKMSYYFKKHYIGLKTTLTCLAFHPVECSIATGDSWGRICIWRNIFEKYPLKDILHWHTLPVHDLYFSKFGNYLFSGGGENVLVKWSLASHSKDFLPRLSSTIHRLSGISESSLLSISTLDNKILIIDFNFQKVSTIQNFARWCISKREKKWNILTFDSRSNCLVLNGQTGHIQFLSLNEDGKFIYTFNVTNRNFVTSDSSCEIENTEVTHARFSKDGKWLVTAEARKDGTYKESRLKFWAHSDRGSSFSLNTNVEFPHEEFGIHSLEISADDVVATTGGDNKFRLWTTFECLKVNKVLEIWSVDSVKKYRNLACHAIDFSKDASLIAVSFGPVLTIWETNSCEFKCSLSMTSRKDDLRFCKFGNNELSHLVVTGTDFSISSWNTITLSMIWNVPLKLSLLLSDPYSIHMAAFSRDNNLIIFNPASPSPDLVLTRVCEHPVVAGQCVLSDSSRFCMYFLTENQHLYCLGDAEKARPSLTKKAGNSFLTPFSAQLAEKVSRAELERGKSVVNKNNNQFVSSLLDSPAHTLPNPSLLCSDILKGLLVFSDGLSSGASVRESKIEKSANSDKVPEDGVNADSQKMEMKLLNVVQAIFVSSE